MFNLIYYLLLITLISILVILLFLDILSNNSAKY